MTRSGLFTIATAMVIHHRDSDGDIMHFCTLDSGLLPVRKADFYTCSIELEANLLHMTCPGFRPAAGIKERQIPRAGSQPAP